MWCLSHHPLGSDNFSNLPLSGFYYVGLWIRWGWMQYVRILYSIARNSCKYCSFRSAFVWHTCLIICTTIYKAHKLSYLYLRIFYKFKRYTNTNLLFVRTINIFFRTNILFVRMILLFGRTIYEFIRTILLFLRTINLLVRTIIYLFVRTILLFVQTINWFTYLSEHKAYYISLDKGM